LYRRAPDLVVDDISVFAQLELLVDCAGFAAAAWLYVGLIRVVAIPTLSKSAGLFSALGCTLVALVLRIMDPDEFWKLTVAAGLWWAACSLPLVLATRKRMPANNALERERGQ
jgi:hypothetical protein